MLKALEQGTVKEYITSGKASIKYMLHEMETMGCIGFIEDKIRNESVEFINRLKDQVNKTVIIPLNKIALKPIELFVHNKKKEDSVEDIDSDEDNDSPENELMDKMQEAMAMIQLLMDTVATSEDDEVSQTILKITSDLNILIQASTADRKEAYDLIIYKWILSACKNQFDTYNLMVHLKESDEEIYALILSTLTLSDELSQALNDL